MGLVCYMPLEHIKAKAISANISGLVWRRIDSKAGLPPNNE